MTALNTRLAVTRLTDTKVWCSAIAIGAALRTMWLAYILLHRVQNIAGVAGTTICSNADAIQTRLIATWNALGAGAILLETVGARAYIGDYATSILAAAER